MNECEIDGKSAASDADIPLLGMESATEGAVRVSEEPVLELRDDSSEEPRVYMGPDSADPESGVLARVSEGGSDESDDGFAVRSAEDVRPVLPASEKLRASPEHGLREVEMTAVGARVSEDEAEDTRVSEDESEDTRVSLVSLSGEVETKMEEDGASEAEAGITTMVTSEARVSVVEDGKGEYSIGNTSSEQSAEETGVSDEGSEGLTYVKGEPEQTRVSMWDSSRLEASETLEARHSWMHGLEIGNMVWGKVKSHPWWPGHIFNEAFATFSVRKTKREGHVLVAFFGDSSYGWFDPAELIPFDPNYAEKSRQMNSRPFLKAVEEAVDEVSRRQALGLSCCCRNSFNFRPTTVAGYFAVDVEGYEPGGVYSAKQIKKARDSFVPVEALFFMNQLAVMPRSAESGSIEWIKNMATLHALRKAMFEEFDATYAEAFGMQPVRPSRDAQGVLDHPENITPRAAPLSGPLVIAEALGERKSSAKTVVKASKDPSLSSLSSSSSKRNKYLFKRREEPPSTTKSPPRSTGPKPSPSSADRRPSPVIGTKPAPPDLHHATPGQGNAHFFTVTPAQQQQSNVHYIPHGQANAIISSLPVFKDTVAAASGNYAAQVGSYVLQKRAPANAEKPRKIPATQEDGKTVGHDIRALSQERVGQATEPIGVSSAEVPHSGSLLVNFQLGRPLAHQDVGVHEFRERSDDATMLDDGSAAVKAGTLGFVDSGGNIFQQERRPAIDVKEEGKGYKIPGLFGAVETKPRFLPPPAGDQAKEGQVSVSFPESATAVPSPMDVVMLPQKLHERKGVGGVMKKEKVRKHPREDHRAGKVDREEKKKKRKREAGPEVGTDHHPLKHPKIAKGGESRRKSTGKSIGIGLVYADNAAQAELQSKVDGADKTSGPSNYATQLPELDLASLILELPQLVDDLSALALDPFHGVDRNASAIVRHVFLRYRSLIYQKSLVLPPASEPDISEPLPGRPFETRIRQETGKGNAEIVSEGATTEHREPVKHARKSTLKPDDPTKMGRKRMPSDRQEEKSAKRLKKLNQLKASSSSEQSSGVGQRASDAHPRGEQKDTGTAQAPVKSIKADSIKKQEPPPLPPPPPKAVIPTYLMMKFPIRTTLPSISSLKARFARFGPLDLSGARVYWKSYTCKVLFKHKSDAQAAYNYARNNDIFGQLKVNYSLREVESTTPELPELTKRVPDDDGPQFRLSSGGGGDSANEVRSTVLRQQQRQYSSQLKSILKRPGDEAAPVGGSVAKETQRVKFLLGGGDSHRGELSVVVSSSNNGGSNADGTSSSLASLQLNSKTPKSVNFVPPPSLPLPLPPSLLPHVSGFQPLQPPLRVSLPGVCETTHLGKVTPQQAQYSETGRWDSSGVDISGQMLNLLMRCSDIVTSVKSTLGYAPYHPL